MLPLGNWIGCKQVELFKEVNKLESETILSDASKSIIQHDLGKRDKKKIRITCKTY